MMRRIAVEYRLVDGYWDAHSPDVPGFVAGDESLAELRVMTLAALTDVMQDERLMLEEHFLDESVPA